MQSIYTGAVRYLSLDSAVLSGSAHGCHCGLAAEVQEPFDPEARVRTGFSCSIIVGCAFSRQALSPGIAHLNIPASFKMPLETYLLEQAFNHPSLAGQV